ncbi:hypothetical protein GV64_11230 [Endozoicomonas elysicola]|uniref:N-acetyltransferase domain-containing protein n=2 Tax=Endozoicomonas elysicola TaxID=305900 RepID=A0A081KAR2_9GAMM|nr:hypothetical protein GV64_11230 [Endozoicomonas elysicola]
MADAHYPGCSFTLGNQAVQSGFWALARSCYHTGIRHYGERLAARYNLALCDLATGQPERAMTQLTRARHLLAGDAAAGGSPDKQRIEQRMAELAAIEQYWKQCSWFTPGNASSKHMSLEPLQERHLPALPGLMESSAFARWANLPMVQADVKGESWWSKWQQSASYDLAVVHHDFGLMGLCGLSRINEVAYFYIWLGYNNPQSALATEATLLALRQMSNLSVGNLCTAVSEKNVSTRRALHQAGFEQLNGRGHSGDEAVLFYGCDLEQGSDQLDTQARMQGWLDVGF